MTLQVVNLSAGYGRLPVIRDVSLGVTDGRIVGLLGANGAGKTTLMRTLSGLATVQGGTFSFCGADVTHLPAESLVERRLIHVPQGRRLFGDMSVRENL